MSSSPLRAVGDEAGPGDLRARRRRDAAAEILRVARHLLVADGPEAVTLRGIAGAMGMSAPALYRYHANHEALVRALVATLYDELTDTLEAARDGAAPEAGRRLVAVCRAFRVWSVTHRAEFGLVFANPLTAVSPAASQEPGDPTGAEAVQRAGERFGAVFVTLFVELLATRGYPAPGEEELDPRFVSRPGPVSDVLPPGPRWVFLRCWQRLYGAIALEVFGQLAWAVDDLDPLFDALMTDLAAALDLEI